MRTDGKQIPLYYFNGHYYGYVESQDVYGEQTIKWSDAFVRAQEIEFLGMRGYLTTLTSRPEDRFLLSNFILKTNNYGVFAKYGWIGATRNQSLMKAVEESGNNQKDCDFYE